MYLTEARGFIRGMNETSKRSIVANYGKCPVRKLMAYLD